MINERSECVRILERLWQADSPALTRKVLIDRPYFVSSITLTNHFAGVGEVAIAKGLGVAECNKSDIFSLSEGDRMSKLRAFRCIADDRQAREVVLAYDEQLLLADLLDFMDDLMAEDLA